MAKCVYLGELKAITKINEEQIECKSVMTALKAIKRIHGTGAYKVAKSSHILVNAQSVTLLHGYKTKLTISDEVRFVPACAGG